MLSMTMGHIVCEKGIFFQCLGQLIYTHTHTNIHTLWHIHSKTVKNVRNHNPKTTHWGAFKLISFWTCASATLSVSVCVCCVCVCVVYARANNNNNTNSATTESEERKFVGRVSWHARIMKPQERNGGGERKRERGEKGRGKL